MDENNPLELFLFTDEPVRELGHDHLALEPFFTMVAAAALTNRGPFNIGVFSGWGQGKTSVLRQAQALIEKQKRPNVITAWVNAWQYEHEEHPIVPLLAIIIDEIAKGIDALKDTHETENAQIAKSFGDLVNTLRSIAYGASFNFRIGVPGILRLGMKLDGKNAIERQEKLAAADTSLVSESLYYEVFNRFETLCSELSKLPKPPKIIVFIDDLDRCLPTKALHLLESLKLVLAQPGFIFVLGVDRHIIDSFLTKRYHREFGIRAEKGHGKQYMDKIIQLPLDLPHHQNRFEKYIGKLIANTASLPAAFSQLFTDAEAGPAFISALAAGCDRTPRSLIRTLNYLLTDLFLREHEYFIVEKDPFASSAEFLQFAAVSRITRITFGSDKELFYRKFVASEAWMGKQIAAFLAAEENVWQSSSVGPEWGYSPGEEGHKEREVDLERIEPYRAAILASESLQELFRSAIGQTWLKERDKRQAIEGFLATREDPGHAPDENSLQIINAAIRVKLDLPEGPVGDEDRKKITSLDLSGTNVGDLTALKSLTNLQGLDLSRTQVSDLTALKGLRVLQSLDLSHSGISDVTFLKDLNDLQSLYLNNTQVRDITPVMSLTNLQTLNLSRTSVSDLTALTSLTSLEGLYLHETLVIDLTALTSLTNLQKITLSRTQVSDLTALKSLTSLQILHLRGTQVSDLRPLYGLKNSLKGLQVRDTPAARNVDSMKTLREALPYTEILS